MGTVFVNVLCDQVQTVSALLQSFATFIAILYEQVTKLCGCTD